MASMLNANEIAERFMPLYQRFTQFPSVQSQMPLLAHYTSVAVVEKIVRDGEIWFSNPLFMNDWEEMRFGLNEGFRLFIDPTRLLKAGRTKEGANTLERCFVYFWKQFEEEGAFDTYVFCLSAHKKEDNDGLLSMWRGYGGSGKGAALVFDPSKISSVPNSPLLFAKVDYATGEERVRQLTELLDGWADISSGINLNEDGLKISAYQAFSVIKAFSLTTKHCGFSEECEWRVVYMPERDAKKLLNPCLSYHLGPNGVEPKLKYRYGSISGVSADGVQLEDIIDRIILGPGISSQLAVKAFKRMLENMGKVSLGSKLVASSIPFRTT